MTLGFWLEMCPSNNQTGPSGRGHEKYTGKINADCYVYTQDMESQQYSWCGCLKIKTFKKPARKPVHTQQ